MEKNIGFGSSNLLKATAILKVRFATLWNLLKQSKACLQNLSESSSLAAKRDALNGGYVEQRGKAR